MFRACVIGTIIYILLFCHYLQFFCNKNIILYDCLTLFFPGCWWKRLSLVKKSFSNKYDVILTLFRKVIYKPNLHIHYDTIQVKGPGGAPTQWLPDWHMFGGSQWQDVHTSSYAPRCPRRAQSYLVWSWSWRGGRKSDCDYPRRIYLGARGIC